MLVVHHLSDSRSQRILWLLEELQVPYEIKFYYRDPVTSRAPPEMKAVHPLGKSPCITDGDLALIESGAIIDYIVRRHGGGRLLPDPASRDYDICQQWLHYADGSAATPLMLLMYMGRLGDAAASVMPAVEAELARHIGFCDDSVKGRAFLVGDSLTVADIQMSFIAEFVGGVGRLDDYPNLKAWVERLQARPAYQAAIARGGPYKLAFKAPPKPQ